MFRSSRSLKQKFPLVSQNRSEQALALEERLVAQSAGTVASFSHPADTVTSHHDLNKPRQQFPCRLGWSLVVMIRGGEVEHARLTPPRRRR